MTQDEPRPGLTARAEAERAARLEREAQALRDNLRRRKQHLRDRDAPPEPDPAGPDPAEP